MNLSINKHNLFSRNTYTIITVVSKVTHHTVHNYITKLFQNVQKVSLPSTKIKVLLNLNLSFRLDYFHKKEKNSPRN